MALKIEFDPEALKELSKLDEPVQRRIFRYFRKRVLPSQDPYRLGKPLTGDKKGLWSYRIGDYRTICAINAAGEKVTVCRIGHRKRIYD